MILIFDHEDRLPRAFHLFSLVFIRINSCLNPILYGATNSTFKEGYDNFWNLLFKRSKYEFSLEIKKKKIQKDKDMEEQMESRRLKKQEKLKNLENLDEIVALEELIPKNLKHAEKKALEQNIESLDEIVALEELIPKNLKHAEKKALEQNIERLDEKVVLENQEMEEDYLSSQKKKTETDALNENLKKIPQKNLKKKIPKSKTFAFESERKE